MRTIYIYFILPFFLFGQGLRAQNPKGHYISFKKTEDLQAYFAYKAGSGSVLISGHRGGREPGYPENSIGGFQNVLNRMPAFFEIDPRLTKDSVIVLMHDATLDRTTNATGKLSGYTWAELQSVRLKDSEGRVTSEKIPTLEDVINWSRGKTIINLDKKDVPFHLIVDLIKKLKAEKHVMLTVHTGEQARYYSERLPGIMLSAFARNDTEYESLATNGVPWKCMIAYVGPAINDANKHIVEKLHSHGVRCMVSFAPTHDQLKTAEERRDAYKREIEKRPDIIESDLPVEVWETLQK
ncbi:MAG: glycerophosphodiester phosphodiesterase family protein [Tannerella sp.]|nr:glycerophosphodiester phosphodiesterase family protein [Tannerella sp.]